MVFDWSLLQTEFMPLHPRNTQGTSLHQTNKNLYSQKNLRVSD
jgi:hypothetical protein